MPQIRQTNHYELLHQINYKLTLMALSQAELEGSVMEIQKQWMRSAVIGCFESEGLCLSFTIDPCSMDGNFRVLNPKNKKRFSMPLPLFCEDWQKLWMEVLEFAKEALKDRVGRSAATGAFYQKRGPQRMRPA